MITREQYLDPIHDTPPDDTFLSPPGTFDLAVTSTLKYAYSFYHQVTIETVFILSSHRSDLFFSQLNTAMSATPPKSPPSRRKTKRLPKKRNRPSISALRAAAARLDYINSLSAEFKAPACVQLLSDDEETHQELEDPVEAEHEDDAQSKAITGMFGTGCEEESSTSMRFQKQGDIKASTMNELNKARRHHSFISYFDSETEGKLLNL